MFPLNVPTDITAITVEDPPPTSKNHSDFFGVCDPYANFREMWKQVKKNDKIADQMPSQINKKCDAYLI